MQMRQLNGGTTAFSILASRVLRPGTEEGGREQWQVLPPSPAELLHWESLSRSTAVVSRTPSSVGVGQCLWIFIIVL